MATHSSVLAWRIPGTGEPGGLPSMGSHRVGRDWSDLAAAAAHMTTGKTIALTTRNFVGKVMLLLFDMLSRLVIAFLPRTKHLLISWLQSPSAVIWEPKKIKSVTVSIVSPSICHEVMGRDAIILKFFKCWVLSQLFHSPLLLLSRESSSSSLSAIRVVSSAYLRLFMFLSAVFIPACASASLAFCMMYSAYTLNKQGDNIQPWRTPFPIWSQFVISCLLLTVDSYCHTHFSGGRSGGLVFSSL